MSREIIKLGMTPCLDRETFDYALNKTECFLHSRSRGLPYRRKRYHTRMYLATRGPSTSMTTTTATMMTRTTITVEIDANGLRVRDEFRIMFLVYDRARRHAS